MRSCKGRGSGTSLEQGFEHRAGVVGHLFSYLGGLTVIWNYLYIAIFGVLGCWARYAMTQLIQGWWGSSFPYATLAINVSGAFVMGFLFVVTLERLTVPPAIRTGVLTGFLGGYTTFSTYALESLMLAETGQAVSAGLYVVLSNVLGVLAAFIGAFIARSL
jgi:CrcB protein